MGSTLRVDGLPSGPPGVGRRRPPAAQHPLQDEGRGAALEHGLDGRAICAAYCCASAWHAADVDIAWVALWYAVTALEAESAARWNSVTPSGSRQCAIHRRQRGPGSRREGIGSSSAAPVRGAASVRRCASRSQTRVPGLSRYGSGVPRPGTPSVPQPAPTATRQWLWLGADRHRPATPHRRGTSPLVEPRSANCERCVRHM